MPDLKYRVSMMISHIAFDSVLGGFAFWADRIEVAETLECTNLREVSGAG